MPTPDLLKIKLFTPIPSVPEIDLDSKMLVKGATSKDCLFTMTEYLSEAVLLSIPKDLRIKQFFDKGLFKSFRKQNPHNILEEKYKSIKKVEPAKEDKKKEIPKETNSVSKQNEIKVGGKDKDDKDKAGTNEKIINNHEVIGTYREIINHNIRLILNTLFHKNNKIVIKGTTYTIGYYNWTDYDWDIDAKRPTFDKQRYVANQTIKKSLEKIPPILRHGSISGDSNDKLSILNSVFDLTTFDDEDESYLNDIKQERERLGLKQGQMTPNGPIVSPEVQIKQEPGLQQTPQEVVIKQEKVPDIVVPSTDSNKSTTSVPVTLETDSNETPKSVIPSTNLSSTQQGGYPSENKSGDNDYYDDRGDFYDSRRSRYDSRRRRSYGKMVNIDESNFAIYISVEIYLVKGETLTPEDEHNLNCKSKWNNVLVPFDKMIGREKRGILPDYSLEKPDVPKPATPMETVTKEPVAPEQPATPKETVTKEQEPKQPSQGGSRHRSKTHRRKKRKTAKNNKNKKRRAFRTTRRRKSKGSMRK